jgi:hypothetical protein
MVLRYMIACITAITVINSRASYTMENDLLTKFTYFVFIEDKVNLASLACNCAFTNFTMWNIIVAIKAFPRLKKIIIITCYALLPIFTRFAM